MAGQLNDSDHTLLMNALLHAAEVYDNDAKALHAAGQTRVAIAMEGQRDAARALSIAVERADKVCLVEWKTC